MWFSKHCKKIQREPNLGPMVTFENAHRTQPVLNDKMVRLRSGQAQ